MSIVVPAPSRRKEFLGESQGMAARLLGANVYSMIVMFKPHAAAPDLVTNIGTQALRVRCRPLQFRNAPTFSPTNLELVPHLDVLRVFPWICLLPSPRMM
jgi:hypothetical protein